MGETRISTAKPPFRRSWAFDIWTKGGSFVESMAVVCNNTIVVVHSVGPISVSWSLISPLSSTLARRAIRRARRLWTCFSAPSPDENEASYGTTIVYNSLSFPVASQLHRTAADQLPARARAGHHTALRVRFGLSFTTFAYSALSIASTGAASTSKVVVTFTVRNSGGVAGTEIPQLYLAYPASAGQPKRVLREFEEVVLAVGTSATFTMTISAREMSIWNIVTQAWVRPAGMFAVNVGASIKDVRLKRTS
ncbi:fibronectin type III-like domain-containing protein [Mycena vulgaris]|nr:fibronectin type III-like domain-containing protein [Mycena vulgaris]KAJ6568066.1 fibronectin type III-like domain-containing protein [Mycena vulgaris]